MRPSLPTTALLATFAFASLAGCASPDDQAENAEDGAAIVGGAESSAAPAVGALSYNLKDGAQTVAHCTATLIAPDVALTTATCVHQYESDRLWMFRAHGGIASLVFTSGDGKAAEVKEFRTHPGFGPRASLGPRDASKDLAYVVLSEPLAGVPVAEVRRTAHVGSCEYVTTGYGVNKVGYDGEALASSEIHVRKSLALCADRGYADGGMIRAYSGGKGSICAGDNGSPLRIANSNVIVGVASFTLSDGSGCQLDDAVYFAPLAPNLAFVDEALAASGVR